MVFGTLKQVLSILQMCCSLVHLCWIVYLTHLDYNDTENIMTEKLLRQVDGTEWSWKNLNTVSLHLHKQVGVVSQLVAMPDPLRSLGGPFAPESVMFWWTVGGFTCCYGIWCQL